MFFVWFCWFLSPRHSKRICFCTLGFPPKLHNNGGKCDFVGEISQLQEFLKDPWIIRVKEGATIQIPVPKVVPPPPPPFVSAVVDGDDAAAAAAEELLSAQTKRVALQKKAAVASMAAEDFARRFESGVLVVSFVQFYSLLDLRQLTQSIFVVLAIDCS